MNFPIQKSIRKLTGFTLVELIVVITILVILATIAFVSLSGYSGSARDSVRTSDLANISKSLDMAFAKNGSYPSPDNSSTVAYLGGALWYQGTIGDSVINIISTAGVRISKKPTDPLVPTKEYAYSKLAYGSAYQLKSDWEGDTIAYLISQTYAASGNPTLSYIKGNYNGLVAKTLTGNTVYVLAVPSIITSQTGTLIDVLTLSGKILINGKTNSGGIAYTPTIVFSGASLPKDDTASGITNLTTALQWAYSGSAIATESAIQNLLKTTGSSNILSLGSSIVTNYLGGSAAVVPGSSSTGSTASYNIGNSLMLDSASGQYLSRTPSVAGNQKKWTWSGWVKKGPSGTATRTLFLQATDVNNRFRIFFEGNDKILTEMITGGGVTFQLATTAVFRDPSAWMHVEISVDTTQTTASDRVKVYINASNQSLTGTYPSQNLDTRVNQMAEHQIGKAFSEYFDGYLADVNFVDSGALDPTAFGQADPTTGQWLPKQYTGTYGTNGFHLDFSSGAALGADSSGGGNNWTLNGSITAANNQVMDTPLNNFATLDTLIDLHDYVSFSKGNLYFSQSAGAGWGPRMHTKSTVEIPTTGKWVFAGTPGSSVNNGFGIGRPATTRTQYAGPVFENEHIIYYPNGQVIKNGISAGIYASFTTGDEIQTCIDMDNGTVSFYKNGTFQVTVGSISTNIPYYAYTPISSSSSSGNGWFNFGQRPFAYTPPTGFKTLSTGNLPDPAIVNPKQYFDVLTYTGNGSNQTITGLGFQPDFVWIKSRNVANFGSITDSVRGISKQLSPHGTVGTSAEYTNANTITAFNSNGFSVGISDYYDVNLNGSSEVAWNWKKGTVPGFDIVSYSGNGSPKTIPHSLGKKPAMVLIKNRTGPAGHWATYHQNMNGANPEHGYLTLSTWLAFTLESAGASRDRWWNSAQPTSSVFSVGAGTASEINTNGSDYISYLWSEVPGFSKFGSYTGNGSEDGPFVYTGFKPRYVMIKRIDGISNWLIIDTARSSYNTPPNELYANIADSEYVSSFTEPDILSNGFKIRTTNTTWNGSAGTYIYAAFAEAPFKYANAR